ncbi:MAG: sugar-binding transcriptional regulator [Firmicutes bacterium]|nr:sugar-binding transcriptional regulator [Bacillota bacterium]
MNKRRIIDIAKLYYELNKSQKEIAEILNISRATVSRKLKEAREKDIVKFSIDYSYHPNFKIEKEIMRKFNAKEVFVADNLYSENDLIFKDISSQLCAFLEEIILDGETIGVSWGNTMNKIANNFCKFNKKNIKVVELNGAIAQSKYSTFAYSILETFASAFNGEPYYLPIPAIVDNKNIAKSFLSDSNISNNLKITEQAQVAIFGIGKINKNSVLYKAGYFKPEEYENLINNGAVGDICARYFDINGALVDKNLNERTLGISLDKLKEKKYSIGIAVGEEKAQPIIGALKKKYVNVLFTDKKTAQKILEIS